MTTTRKRGSRAALLAALLVVATAGVSRPEVGFTEATPSKDDPPAQTRSTKVQPSRDLSLPPALGPNPAKVYVVVFCDFLNPDCRRMVPAVRQLPEEWPGDVRLEYRQLPTLMPTNVQAAVAALAAHRQGKFWPMYDCLYESQDTLDGEKIDHCASEASVDMRRYGKDLADPALRERVRQDIATMRQLGGSHAPAYTVNGRLHLGWASWELFRGAVERELKQVKALLEKKKKLADVELARARENTRNEEAFVAYRTAILTPLAKAKPSGSR